MSAARRAMLIYNPHAGFRNAGSALAEFLAFWQARGWQMGMQPTAYPGHATELARAAAAEGIQIVFAAGGDGTLNEVANGLAHSETVLAPVPVGTSNSFAKELGIRAPGWLNNAWLLAASSLLAEGCIHAMDLGHSSDGRFWLLWASTGADGILVHRIEPRSRQFKRLGPLGYAAKALIFLPSVYGVAAKVTVDDASVEGDLLMINISNARLYAGGEVLLNPHAVLDDGLFEVRTFRGKRWPMLLRYGLTMSLAYQDQDPNVDLLIGRHVCVETERPVPFHLDAEPAGFTPLICDLHPGALRLLVPPTAPDGLFLRPGEALAV